MTSTGVPLPLLGGLLFSLMGPVALLPLFASVTAGADRRLRLRIALTAAVVATVTIAVAVFVGAGAMARLGTSPSSLIIAAGLILLLTAFRNIFGTGAGASDTRSNPPTTALGFMPIAIPGIVTPVAVAVLIIFVSYFPSDADKLAIMAVVFAIMMLNLAAMLGARLFMERIGSAPLVVLGAVFGVLQAAMGVEMIISGLTRSRLLT
jgi:multiple antibiotic resistance protein